MNAQAAEPVAFDLVDFSLRHQVSVIRQPQHQGAYGLEPVNDDGSVPRCHREPESFEVGNGVVYPR